MKCKPLEKRYLRCWRKPLRAGIEWAVSEKSGKLKFAFAWNLRGGAQTQGFLGSRKESPQSLTPTQTIDFSLFTSSSNAGMSTREA
jgi:hypothetical protein